VLKTPQKARSAGFEAAEQAQNSIDKQRQSKGSLP
jgi:hypothetical protein